MKGSLLLQLAALGTAFVIPNEQVSSLQHVQIEARPAGSVLDRLPSKPAELLNGLESTIEHIAHDLKDTVHGASRTIEEFEGVSKHTFDDAVAYVKDAGVDMSDKIHDTYFDVQGWLDSALENEVDMADLDLHKMKKGGCHGRNPERAERLDDGEEPPHHGKPPHHDKPPHDGPPHDGPPHDGPPHGGPPHGGPPHHGPHGPHGPHHGGPHHKSNLTVYQLINSSKYSTKLAALINQYPDLVETLNGTAANYTVFAPTDRAFEKIPEGAPKPSKEQLKALLTYHISADFYPAGRILVSRTIPSLLKLDVIDAPQRLSTNIGPRGLTVNFYSRIVAVDIFGTNGVIHGVDSIIIPPPKTAKILDLLPSEFSTLTLALTKTGLYEQLNATDGHFGTLFAPSNFAFAKLGPKINAFLFSSYGLKYLKALLQFHAAPSQILYSDAFYKSSSEDKEGLMTKEGRPGVPKGFYHVDLPTLLEDHSLSIDIARYGRIIDIKINAFSRVIVSDGVAADGVLHVVGDVLIPPKKLGGLVEEGEMTVEEFKRRFEPFVEEGEQGWGDL